MSYPTDKLTFAEFSEVNKRRCTRWHSSFPSEDPGGWTGADWSNAMCGEAGEVANVVKKLRRGETGASSTRDGSRADLLAELEKEIGDVYAYLDLLAQYYGLDMASCVSVAFNQVSEREGFPERIDP